MDMTWLAHEAKNLHQTFQSFFYLICLTLLLFGLLIEYFKWPLGQMPTFMQLVGRTVVAAIILNAYPEITNTLANLTDALSHQLGNMNEFHLVLDRMGDKLGELSWSWVSVKETVILVISFLTFFLLYFSVHIADAFYLYAWTLLYVFSPLLIALYVLPVTANATSALFRSLIEVSAWKVVWSVLAALLWSTALSDINKDASEVSFLTAIAFNIILAGSLLLTPFIVHALAGGGMASMAKDLGGVAIGGMAFSPGTAVNIGKIAGGKAASFSRDRLGAMKEKFQINRAVRARRNAKPSPYANYATQIKARNDDK